MRRLVVAVGLFLFVTLGFSQQFIADYSVAKEEVLRSIPENVIAQVRNDFKILYFHTSHGTHVTFGVNGLQRYKTGDDVLFAAKVVDVRYEKVSPAVDSLELYDWYGWDLSEQESTFDDYTRNFLDDDKYADVNVVMWSWCDITGHEPNNYYLPKMQALINEYGEGGSKIGTGEGLREVPVKFIFMTGHAVENNNIGDGKPKNQADLITDFCNTHNYFCLDYYSIDTHDMSDNYWDDSSDDSYSKKYKIDGGTTYQFYVDYQDTHILGSDYFYNKDFAGNVATGEHLTQHITSNRKAYAMWWILARLTGWGDITTKVSPTALNSADIIYNQGLKQLSIKNHLSDGSVCKVYNLAGSLCLEQKVYSSSVSLAGLHKGLYIVSLNSPEGVITKKILIRD